MNHWSLRYEGFDPDTEGLREAMCTLGNGFLARRRPAEPEGVRWATDDEQLDIVAEDLGRSTYLHKVDLHAGRQSVRHRFRDHLCVAEHRLEHHECTHRLRPPSR